MMKLFRSLAIGLLCVVGAAEVAKADELEEKIREALILKGQGDFHNAVCILGNVHQKFCGGAYNAKVSDASYCIQNAFVQNLRGNYGNITVIDINRFLWLHRTFIMSTEPSKVVVSKRIYDTLAIVITNPQVRDLVVRFLFTALINWDRPIDEAVDEVGGHKVFPIPFYKFDVGLLCESILTQCLKMPMGEVKQVIETGTKKAQAEWENAKRQSRWAREFEEAKKAKLTQFEFYTKALRVNPAYFPIDQKFQITKEMVIPFLKDIGLTDGQIELVQIKSPCYFMRGRDDGIFVFYFEPDYFITPVPSGKIKKRLEQVYEQASKMCIRATVQDLAKELDYTSVADLKKALMQSPEVLQAARQKIREWDDPIIVLDGALEELIWAAREHQYREEQRLVEEEKKRIALEQEQERERQEQLERQRQLAEQQKKEQQERERQEEHKQRWRTESKFAFTPYGFECLYNALYGVKYGDSKTKANFISIHVHDGYHAQYIEVDEATTAKFLINKCGLNRQKIEQGKIRLRLIIVDVDVHSQYDDIEKKMWQYARYNENRRWQYTYADDCDHQYMKNNVFTAINSYASKKTFGQKLSEGWDEWVARQTGYTPTPGPAKETRTIFYVDKSSTYPCFKSKTETKTVWK